MFLNIEIKNAPEVARQFIVARPVVNHKTFVTEFWYFGSYDTSDRAYFSAAEVDGVVLENKKIVD